VAGSCEYGDEHSGSGSTEIVTITSADTDIMLNKASWEMYKDIRPKVLRNADNVCQDIRQMFVFKYVVPYAPRKSLHENK
jgi:hypothetical protein